MWTGSWQRITCKSMCLFLDFIVFFDATNFLLGLTHEIKKHISSGLAPWNPEIFHRGKIREWHIVIKITCFTCYYIIKTSLFIFYSPHLRSSGAASNDALNSMVIKFLFNYLFCIICCKQSMEMCWFYSYNKSSISIIIFNILHLTNKYKKTSLEATCL